MKLIVACDPNGGIGYNNKLPWSNIQGDLPRFKHLTNNGVVVMGRNTWESLPKKPLSGRLNLIVSSQELILPPGAIRISDLSHFTQFKNVWIIGGAKLINSCWDLIDEIYLTRTISEYTCDTFIDLVQLKETFSMVSMQEHPDHTYEIWKKR
jgi:dihydrofolate reductase